MVERYVFIRLQEQYQTAEARAEVVRETLRALPELPGVLDLRVGTPADDSCQSSWDVSLVVRFASLDDIEAYRVHSAHRAYVDVFLKPRMAGIKAWNFAVSENRGREG
jgi:hypothetical protein